MSPAGDGLSARVLGDCLVGARAERRRVIDRCGRRHHDRRVVRRHHDGRVDSRRVGGRGIAKAGWSAGAAGSTSGRAGTDATLTVEGTLASFSARAGPPWFARLDTTARPPPRLTWAGGRPAADAAGANSVGTCDPPTSPAASAPTTARAELATVATPGPRGIRPSTGACASQESGPIASRSRPSEMLRNARTTRGSNWSPAQRAISSRAAIGVARLLVRARGGDHVEHVGDGDDAAGERDVVARRALRVALAVPALVVVGDRVRPLPEPRAQRLGQLGAELGMAADQRPLVARSAGPAC